MINKIILSLYDHYRKNNDPFPAVFHSKAIFGLLLLIISTISFCLLPVYNVKNDLGFSDLRIVGFGLMAIVFVILWFSTDSAVLLETKRAQAAKKYKTLFFVVYYISIPILIYAIVNYKK